ncbi:MAG: DUF2148 domain-containing protein [bacterium]
MDRSHEVEGLMMVAKLMCAAARTAPKGRGVDLLVTHILTGEEKSSVAAHMREIGTKVKQPFFLRDADNLDAAPAAVLLGTRVEPMGVDFYCDMCGFGSCQQTKERGGICIFNSHDLGIAVGSAASVASRHHIDCRIMYTIGIAARDLNLLGEGIRIAMGIPLSVTGKNIFFDREKKKEEKK